MQHVIGKAKRMSQGAQDTTKRSGTGEDKKIAPKKEITKYTGKYMYDDKGNKYPVSTTTTSKGKPYPGQVYTTKPRATPKFGGK